MIKLLTGSNAYKRAEELTALKNAFQNQYGSEGIETYRGDQLEPSELTNLLGGISLFATNRLVIITDLSANKLAAEKFVDLIESVSDQVQIVLIESQPDKRTRFYKTLQKKATVIACEELEEYQLAKWIAEYAKAEQGSIDSHATQLLIRSVGADQLRLKNELDKLLAYEKTITSANIDLLVEKRPEDTVFQLLDAALGGKTTQAIQVLEGLERAHEDPFQIVNMLIWQTHILAVVYSAGSRSDAEVAKVLKASPFVVRKTQNLANRLNGTKLQTILDSVASLDVSLKTTSSDPWRSLEQTLLQF